MKKKKAVDEKGLPANLSAPDSEVHPGTGKSGRGGQEVQHATGKVPTLEDEFVTFLQRKLLVALTFKMSSEAMLEPKLLFTCCYLLLFTPYLLLSIEANCMEDKLEIEKPSFLLSLPCT